MQWNCPHCGIYLAIQDQAIGSGWSFSRCFQCGGFALIRRAEINVIKVDKAPSGERVILPESAENPRNGMLPEVAARKLGSKFAKPVVRSAASPKKAGASNSAAQDFSSLHPWQSNKRDINSDRLLESQTHPTDTAGEQIFVPPPRSPEMSRASAGNAGPQASDLNYAMDLLSSHSLNSDGNAHWSDGDDLLESTSPFPHPLPDPPSRKSSKKNFIPMAIAAASSAVLVSGIVLILQGKTLLHTTQPAFLSQKFSAAETAQVPDAPTRTPAEQKASVPLQTIPELHTAISHMLPQGPQNPVYSSPLRVQIRVRKANLHTGPGLQFPLAGSTLLGERYLATQEKTGWYKIALAGRSDPAWIRNDLVQIVVP